MVPSGIEEPVDPNHSAAEHVRKVALDKALHVARKERRGIVVGADTEVIYRGRIFGKPRSKADARRMLAALSGRTHTVYTGVAVVDAASGQRTTFVESTRVTFRRLSTGEIRSYAATGAPMDKAGAYGIQDDRGAVFVKRIEGDFSTVVGFPLARFTMVLNAFLRRRH